MLITVINVEVENKGKFRQAIVAYKGPDGKVEGKKIVSFGPSKEVFPVISEAQPGDVFDVKNEKVAGSDGKEYWNWTGIVAAGKASAVPVGKVSGGSAAPRTTYETPEERARKQVYIVRQSQITNAITLLTHNNPKGAIDTDTVISVARQFVDFVLGNELQDVDVI